MFACLQRLTVILLFFTLMACGRGGTTNSPAATTGVTPSPVVGSTATSPLTPSSTQASTPSATPAAPIGLVRLNDPTGDVTDMSDASVLNARPFVDLTAVSLQIDTAQLALTIDTAGSIPQALDPGDEMIWALEISPPDPASLTLYRVTETISGATWSTTKFDFEHDGQVIPAKVDAHGNEISICIALTEFPKIDGPFRWWVAALWGGFDASRAYGDRVPDGDPAWFPAEAAPVAMTWEDLPEKTAPAGLGTVLLPTDDADAAALLAGMPDEISGLPRSPENVQGQLGVRRVVYDAEADTQFASMSLMAIDATDPFSEWPPGTTGRDVIELFTSGIDVIDDAGRDGQLGWVRLHIHETLQNGSTRVSQALLWADADSHWYFAASTDTSEHLDTLLAAFVTAARTGD